MKTIVAVLSSLLISCAVAPEDTNETAQFSVMPSSPVQCPHNPPLSSELPCVVLTQLAPAQWNWYACGNVQNCAVANNQNGGNNATCASACGLPTLASYGSAPHSTYNTAACVWADTVGFNEHIGICTFESKSN